MLNLFGICNCCIFCCQMKKVRRLKELSFPMLRRSACSGLGRFSRSGSRSAAATQEVRWNWIRCHLATCSPSSRLWTGTGAESSKRLFCWRKCQAVTDLDTPRSLPRTLSSNKKPIPTLRTDSSRAKVPPSLGSYSGSKSWASGSLASVATFVSRSYKYTVPTNGWIYLNYSATHQCPKYNFYQAPALQACEDFTNPQLWTTCWRKD